MIKTLKTTSSILILLFLSVSVLAQQTVSLSSLLKEMTDTRSISYWPEMAFSTKQASSYDRSSLAPNQPGWYSNADFSQYIRTEEKSGRVEHVMLDAKGPGAILRFWLTTFKRKGTLRIYFDNQDTAAIEIPAYDLLKSGFELGPGLLAAHSSYQPLEKGGSTLYLPLPYAKHCKVTWQEAEQEKQPRYYQINYRTYAPGTRVITFNRQQLTAAKQIIEQTEKKLWNPAIVLAGSKTKLGENLKSGQSTSLKLESGPHSIDLMKIKITARDSSLQAQALRSVILKITFDGIETVWCPIGDFSGSGVGGKMLNSWYRDVKKDGEIISRWAMPYKKSAVISIVNLSGNPVDVNLITTSSPYKWSSTSLYFHASWIQKRHEEIFKWEEPKAAEMNFITIKGKGIYLGNSMAVYNHMHTWYGEGDQKIWVDEDRFPSEFGTGTEDYYNTSWAPVVLYQTPFANAPRADHEDSFGYNTFTRTRNLDRIPFKHFFKMDMEMLGWKHGDADFAVTTYWYGNAKAKHNIKDMTNEAKVVLPK